MKSALLNLILDAADKKSIPVKWIFVLLTELPTVRATNKLSNVPGDIYNVFAEIGGRAAIVTKGISSWRCPQYFGKDIIVCQTKINDKLTYLVSLYCPTFRNYSGNLSIINITFANYNLATSIYNWKVNNDLHISDHYRISFLKNNSSNFRIADASDWNFRKGNWNLFQLELDRNMLKWSNSRHWTATSIVEKLNEFLNILNNTLIKTIPKKIFKRKYKYPPWWDEKFTILHSKCRKLAKNKTPAGRDLYTSLRREYKKAIITAKRDGWLKFTYKIKYPSNISNLIKSFNNSKNNALGLLKNREGDYCDNPTVS